MDNLRLFIVLFSTFTFVLAQPDQGFTLPSCSEQQTAQLVNRMQACSSDLIQYGKLNFMKLFSKTKDNQVYQSLCTKIKDLSECATSTLKSFTCMDSLIIESVDKVMAAAKSSLNYLCQDSAKNAQDFFVNNGVICAQSVMYPVGNCLKDVFQEHSNNPTQYIMNLDESTEKFCMKRNDMRSCFTSINSVNCNSTVKEIFTTTVDKLIDSICQTEAVTTTKKGIEESKDKATDSPMPTSVVGNSDAEKNNKESKKLDSHSNVDDNTGDGSNRGSKLLMSSLPIFIFVLLSLL